MSPRQLSRLGCFVLASLLGACQQAPIAPLPDASLRASEHIFAIFCKRLARESAPNHPDGAPFDEACRTGDPASLVGTSASPALQALVARRSEVVEGLDHALGAARATDPVLTFAEAPKDGGELDQFLYQLLPFYERTIPELTRSAATLAQTLAAAEHDAEAVLAFLERNAARRGYRAPGQGLSGVRAVLTYPRLDALLRAFTSLVVQGGAGETAFRGLLGAGALELADTPGEPASEERWLAVLTDLLLRPLTAPDDPTRPYPEPLASPPRHVVKRDDAGDAEGTGSSPFPIPGQPDPDASARLPDGRLPSFHYRDATQTFLSALLRSARPLWSAAADGTRPWIALAGSVAPLLGPPATHRYAFHSGREVEQEGFDLAQAPLLDAVHALASVLTLPETDALLAVLRAMLRHDEPALAGLLHLALEIDRMADDYPDATPSGWDGTPATRSEFWDDVIAYAQGLGDRPGMLEAIVRSYSKPSAVAQLALLAKMMKYNDRVTYPGARITPEEVHDEADVARYNAPISWQLSSLVDRAKPDYGMNRSLFQRLLSTVGAVLNQPFCNKEGAFMSVPDPTNPSGTLAFPNPSGQPGANLLLTGVIDLVCPPSSPALTYVRCGLVEHPNIAEAHMRTILGRLELRLKDPQLVCLMETGLAGDLGAQQEALSQIQGYSLTPTAEAFTRFTYVAPNRFVSNLSATQLTRDGVPIVQFEPDYSFVLEAKQDDVLLNGQPASFMDVSKDLAMAFDDHEYFEDTPNGEVATRGYRYAELLALLHTHWPSPRTADCPQTVEPGNEGCSQRLDPARPFYAKQSNLVSYEPLLIRAQEELQLGAIVQQALAAMAQVWIAPDETGGPPRSVAPNTPGAKDGITVLTEFIVAMITPRDAYTYRDGRHEAATNGCQLGKSAATGEPRCENGAGRVLPQTSPLYLVLDALHAMDVAWARPENAARHETWLAGRAQLVDTLLAVERIGGEDDASRTFQLRDRRLRALLLSLLDWLQAELLATRHPLSGDRVSWATGDQGLSARLEAVLAHPLTRNATALLEAVAGDPVATAELSDLLAHLLDADAHPDTFADVTLAAVDLLAYASREPDLTPLARLLAWAIAPNAAAAVRPGGPAPEVEAGAAYASTVLLHHVADLPAYRDTATSPLAKLLHNLASRDAAGRSALERLFDVVVEVNRADPLKPSDAPLDAREMRHALLAVAHFLRDPERGLERLYEVIAHREGDVAEATP